MGQLNERKEAKRKNQRPRSTLSIPGFGVLKPSAQNELCCSLVGSIVDPFPDAQTK